MTTMTTTTTTRVRMSSR